MVQRKQSLTAESGIIYNSNGAKATISNLIFQFMNNLWNIILSTLTLVAGGGWLFDRRRHRQEIESLKADNRQKDMNLSKMYVEEFKENIADPLRREVRELRTEVNHLRNAIQKINDCPHSDACPVYSELQKQQDRDAADQHDGRD